VFETFFGPLDKYLTSHGKHTCKSAVKCLLFMLDLKNCNGTKTFSESPHIKFHNPLAVLESIQKDRQTDMAKLGGVLI
jgi:hypothetical protein